MQLPWSKSRKQKRFYRQLFPHADALYNYALRLSANPADAEDLVQESLLKAYNALDRVPEGSHYKGWLFTILRNTHLSRMRRAGRIQFSDSPPDQPDRRPDPHRLLELGQGQRKTDQFDDQVLKALAALPEVQRSAVILCDVERMQYDDIAKIMGCPVGTIRSRIFHARRALRAALKKYATEAGVIRHPKVAVSKG